MAATDFNRIATAAGTGVARSLLLEHFAGRAGDFASSLSSHGALPLIGVVHDQCLLQQRVADFSAKLGFVDLDLFDLLAGLIEYWDFDHGSVLCHLSFGPIA